MRIAERNAARRGFTLLELLVVVAILALLAGGLIASYEGLENKTSEGLAAFNIAALDGLIRQYAATNGSLYPNDNDSLLFSSSTSSSASASPLNIMNQDKLIKRIGPYSLTQDDVDALQSIGITSARYVTSGSKTYNNSLPPRAGGSGTQPPTPNRVFDDPTSEFGWGNSLPLTAGSTVAAIAVGDGSNNLIKSFSTTDTDPITANLENELFGLPAGTAHLIVVFGVGNKSTLVQGFTGQLDARSRGAGLSQAPYYNKVKPWEYGRFLACYLLAYRDGSEWKYLDKPRFLTCLDGRGGCLDEENAEWRGTQD